MDYHILMTVLITGKVVVRTWIEIDKENGGWVSGC
jgi:hypothetical protein